MKNLITKVDSACILAALLASLLVRATAAQAASLPDFGHRHIRINGRLASGGRPLVVIMANFSGAPAFAHNAAYFDSLIFDLTHPLTPRSLNSFFLENSNGRFFWNRAGIIGPILFSAAERKMNYPGTDQSAAYYSNIVAKAISPIPEGAWRGVEGLIDGRNS